MSQLRLMPNLDFLSLPVTVTVEPFGTFVLRETGQVSPKTPREATLLLVEAMMQSISFPEVQGMICPWFPGAHLCADLIVNAEWRIGDMKAPPGAPYCPPRNEAGDEDLVYIVPNADTRVIYLDLLVRNSVVRGTTSPSQEYVDPTTPDWCVTYHNFGVTRISDKL